MSDSWDKWRDINQSHAVAILYLSTEGAWVPSDIDKIEELSFQSYGPQNQVKNCCIGANKHTRLEMTNKLQ